MQIYIFHLEIVGLVQWNLKMHFAAQLVIYVTVSVRSGVFRHNRDSVGTSGLYRHNKTSLLALATKMSSTELVPKNNQPEKDTFHVKRK